MPSGPSSISSSTLEVVGSSSSKSAANPQTSTLEVMELKRKLDMVTEELSLNRMKLAKRSRRDTASEGQVVIEIPDFPMEFYNVAEGARITGARGTPLQKWFGNFSKHPMIRKQPKAYHDWIQARTLDLFPKILTVIGNNLKGDDRITGSDLLSCRRVNKSWKKSIDKFIQDSVPLDTLQPFLSTDKKSIMKVATCIRSDNLQALLEMICSLEKNKHLQTLTPFPSGRLCLEYLPQMEQGHEVAFNSALEILLEFHGARVQSFTFHDVHKRLDILLMSRWLKKMPNVKALEICNVASQPTCRSYRVPCYFPRLPKLITFVGLHVPSELTEVMLRLNPQIRNLKVGSPQPLLSKRGQLSLTSLSVNVSSLTQLQSIAGLQLPLQMLKLDGRGGDVMELDEVFQVLRRYEGTLKELYLEWKVADNTNMSSLKLPRLQHLHLFMIPSSPMKISFDFLLPLESLESLEIYFTNGEENLREMDLSQVIQLVGYLDRMSESNLWKLFPILKRLVIWRFKDTKYIPCVYTRDSG